MPVKYTQNELYLMFNTTETSEPAADVGRTSRAKAVRGGYMSTEHPVIAWSSEIGIANLQIGAHFINKLQI